jgi:hypothetical protein
MSQFHRRPIVEVLGGGPGGEFAKQRRIRPLRVLGLPPFMAEVLQKIFDEHLHGSGGGVPASAKPEDWKVIFHTHHFASRNLSQPASCCTGNRRQR